MMDNSTSAELRCYSTESKLKIQNNRALKTTP